VFYLAKRKNKKLIERMDPICQQWSLGDLAPWLLQHLRQTSGSTLWTMADQAALERALKRLPVQQTHRLLRKEYTLYSLKRGALQQLGHLEKDWKKIQCLSLHAQLECLAVYIGAFLNVKVQASKEMTALLSKPPPTPVPHELQPVPREMRDQRQKDKVETRQERPMTPPPRLVPPPPMQYDEPLDLDFLDSDLPPELRNPIATRSRKFTPNEIAKIQAAPQMCRRSQK